MTTKPERRAAPFSMRLPHDLKTDLEALAREDRRSMAQEIIVALEEFVERRKAEGKPAGKRK